MKYLLCFIVCTILICGCGGTHGKIKSYSFECTNEELLLAVDNYLREHRNYRSKVDDDNGWIYIQIPEDKNRFGYKIGNNSRISLLSAGLNGARTKWDSDLGFNEKKKLIASFEKYFINKIKCSGVIINDVKMALRKYPFLLASNKGVDTVSWPHYVIRHDTLVRYPLPSEITSLGIDYFTDLVVDYTRYSSQKINIHQYYNLFRINLDSTDYSEIANFINYTGYLSNGSIVIDSYNRVIGQHREFNPIFAQKRWSEFIENVNETERTKDYKEYRAEKKAKGHYMTTVYHDMYKEYWMNQYAVDTSLHR